ncbi:hypothetical protein C922_05123, partial [Plasmodium inui San Antonio 1]
MFRKKYKVLHILSKHEKKEKSSKDSVIADIETFRTCKCKGALNKWFLFLKILIVPFLIWNLQYPSNSCTSDESCDWGNGLRKNPPRSGNRILIQTQHIERINHGDDPVVCSRRNQYLRESNVKSRFSRSATKYHDKEKKMSEKMTSNNNTMKAEFKDPFLKREKRTSRMNRKGNINLYDNIQDIYDVYHNINNDLKSYQENRLLIFHKDNVNVESTKSCKNGNTCSDLGESYDEQGENEPDSYDLKGQDDLGKDEGGDQHGKEEDKKAGKEQGKEGNQKEDAGDHNREEDKGEKSKDGEENRDNGKKHNDDDEKEDDDKKDDDKKDDEKKDDEKKDDDKKDDDKKDD